MGECRSALASSSHVFTFLSFTTSPRPRPSLPPCPPLCRATYLSLQPVSIYLRKKACCILYHRHNLYVLVAASTLSGGSNFRCACVRCCVHVRMCVCDVQLLHERVNDTSHRHNITITSLLSFLFLCSSLSIHAVSSAHRPHSSLYPLNPASANVI